MIEGFFDEPNAWTLHNATTEWVVLNWHGESRRVPPRGEVVAPIPHAPDACASARDEDGQLIPGTLVIKDVRKGNLGGGSELIWDARNAIRAVLGFDVKTGRYLGATGLKGVSVLPEHPTKEQVAEVDAAGRERWRKWKIKDALATVQKYEAKNAALARIGLQPRETSRDYLEAKAIVDAAQVADRHAAEEMLGLLVGKQTAGESYTRVGATEEPTGDLSDVAALREELAALKATIESNLNSKPKKRSNRLSQKPVGT